MVGDDDVPRSTYQGRESCIAFASEISTDVRAAGHSQRGMESMAAIAVRGSHERHPACCHSFSCAVRDVAFARDATVIQPKGIPFSDNASHSAIRAAQILLVNNASTPTALPLITRFLLPRTPAAASRMRQHGQHGWIPSVLHMLLRIALEPLLNHTALSHHISPSLPLNPQSLAAAISPEALVGVSIGAAASTGASTGGSGGGSGGGEEVLAGVVEFESAFSRASDAHPMCFHRLVLPGYLKAITFAGGMEQADMFKHRLKEAFPHPKPDPFHTLASPDNASIGDVSAGRSSADSATVRLLYITRYASLTRGRRVMSAESSSALLKLFHQLKFEFTR
ncbi:unnamed protein product [Closterium sp. Yama58-4]|nr:unnamed protein product [Closterium sp. Yama58-4]